MRARRGQSCRRRRGARSPRFSLTCAAIIASMFLLDRTASDWARHLPGWFIEAFEQITDFGLSGWFLYPLGVILLGLAAVASPASPRLAQGVFAALGARFGFLFVAIAAPGLFTTIVKRLIGRARPYVGGYDNPFLYKPFIWQPAYASMPSGHATTAAAAAVAIGAVWPARAPADVALRADDHVQPRRRRRPSPERRARRRAGRCGRCAAVAPPLCRAAACVFAARSAAVSVALVAAPQGRRPPPRRKRARHRRRPIEPALATL